MSVEYPRIFRPNGFGDALLHLQDLHSSLNQSGFEPADLIRNLRRFDRVARHVIEIIPGHVDDAVGDARGYPRPLQSNFRRRLITHSAARLAAMSKSRKC